MQRTVDCPTCGAPAIVRLTRYVTGERAGVEEYDLTCRTRHCGATQEQLQTLWRT